ncbi:MAG: hypothetical protein AAF456_16320 [Planctomycetota bacterium]
MFCSGSKVLALVIATFAFAGIQSEVFGQTMPQAQFRPVEFQLDAIRARVDASQEDLSELMEHRESITEQFGVLLRQRENLMEQQDSAGVSENSFSEIMKSLQSQRVQLIIDLAGLEARRMALENARLESQARLNQDDLTLPLERLLEIQEQNLARLRELFMQGAVSPDDVNAAEQRMLEAKIQLAQARGPSVGASDSLASQLLEVSLERADKSARLDKTERLLETIAASRTLVSRADNIDREITILETELSATDSNINNAKEEFNQLIRQLAAFEEMYVREMQNIEAEQTAPESVENVDQTSSEESAEMTEAETPVEEESQTSESSEAGTSDEAEGEDAEGDSDQESDSANSESEEPAREDMPEEGEAESADEGEETEGESEQTDEETEEPEGGDEGSGSSEEADESEDESSEAEGDG